MEYKNILKQQLEGANQVYLLVSDGIDFGDKAIAPTPEMQGKIRALEAVDSVIFDLRRRLQETYQTTSAGEV